MNKEEQIKEIAKERNEIKDIMKLLDKCVSLNPMYKAEVATVVYANNYRKIPEDSVVISREEYEKLKSLYDTQKGAIMTSKIGDLPLTVAGLRKAVDEITRLNNVEAELQELNMKYYNEAKDLRRKLAKAETENQKRLKANEDFSTKHCYMKCEIAKTLVKEFAQKLKEKFGDYEVWHYDGENEAWHDLQSEIDECVKEYENGKS